MFYTINAENEQIIDFSSKCPDPQEQADFFDCEIYIIEGEHSGLSASPQNAKESQDDQH